MDAYFDDEPGYRIRPDEFALPDISLTADEAAVVGLATKVWQHARLAEATTEAVRKLTALGVDVDLSALDIVEPRLNADEPSFDVFWEATQERTPVTFDYVRSGDRPRSRTRHLQPWGVARYSGRWYVVGFDTDRRGRAGLPPLPGPGRAHARSAQPGSYDVPPGTDVSEVARRLAPEPSTERVVLLVRKGAGHTLRRGADRVEEGVAGPDDATRPGTGWCSTRGSVGLADEVLGYGADVVVEEPAELRDRVVDRLRAAVGGPRRPRDAPRRQREGPGRPAADPGALPARPRRGPARRGGPGARRRRRTSCSSDLKVLFMCGLPGGYPDDLIDVDIDALEGPDGVRSDGVIRVSNADYLARPLRLSPTEASAVIVALRALRNGARDDTREVVDRALAKLEAAAAEGGARRGPDRPRRRRRRHRPGAARQPAPDRGRPRPAGAAELLRARAATSSPTGWSTRAGWSRPRDTSTSTPGATAPRRRGCSGWTGSTAPRCSTTRSRRPRRAPRDLGDGFFTQSTDVTPVTLLLEPEARWMTDVLPGRGNPRGRPGPNGGRPARRRRALADPADAAAGTARDGSCHPRRTPTRSWPPHSGRSACTPDRRRTMETDRTNHVRTPMTALLIGGLGTHRAAHHPGRPRPALRRRQASRARPRQRPGAADLQGRDQGPDGRRRRRRRPTPPKTQAQLELEAKQRDLAAAPGRARRRGRAPAPRRHRLTRPLLDQAPRRAPQGQPAPPCRPRRPDGAVRPPARAARPAAPVGAGRGGGVRRRAVLLRPAARPRPRSPTTTPGAAGRVGPDRGGGQRRHRPAAAPAQALRRRRDRRLQPATGSTRSGRSSCPGCTPASGSGRGSSPRSPGRCSSPGWLTGYYVLPKAHRGADRLHAGRTSPTSSSSASSSRSSPGCCWSSASPSRSRCSW